jgi:hypothetical protein
MLNPCEVTQSVSKMEASPTKAWWARWWIRALLLLLYHHPLLAIASIYLAWLILAFELGRLPRAMVDSPRSFPSAFALYTAAIVYYSLPLTVVFGMLAAVLYPFAGARQLTVANALASLILYLSILVATYQVVRADAGGALTWFFD